MKLRSKFMGAVGVVLVILAVADVMLSMQKDRNMMTNDIRKWTFLFAENVRISMNTLMREGKMDMRFAMFEGMMNEIEGLKSVRVIRSKKVDDLFRIVAEKDIIPREKKRIANLNADIADLQEELADATDRDERDDLRSEIEFLKRDLKKSESMIESSLEKRTIDKREKAVDEIDKKVLKTGQAVYRLDGEMARVVIPYKVKKKGCSETSGCHRYAKEGDVLGGVSLEFSLADLHREMDKNNVKTGLFGFIRLAIILLTILLVLTLAITRPLNGVVEMLKNIASGRGDLTKRLEVDRSDEMGVLAKWFNTFVEGMQALVKDIFIVTSQITGVSADVKKASTELMESSHAQKEAIEETSSSISEMNSSILSVASETDEQLKSTEYASSSILEMLSSIAEVTEHTDHLSESVDKTASAINQIVASLKEVGSHVDTLFMETGSVVSAATEINFSVKEVTGHVREKAVLAEKVKENASSLGLNAVRKTASGIEKIKVEVSATAGMIDRLEERSGEIGRIIGVIEDVAETTNLLSFNAAIIAARAGEHGKSFAVVADEVKSLSRKTAASTKEIANLVRLVQGEISQSKKSMHNSLVSVEEGVSLSKEAGEALTEIIGNADSSLEMAKRVEIATGEQTSVMGKVTDAVQRINDMVEEIKRAIDEQKGSTDQILHASEDMKDITQVVRRSTKEQSKESDNITKVITDVSHKMQAIARATTEQKNASEVIVRAVETMKDQIENNVILADQLDGSVKELENQQEVLKAKVESFKV